jgi:hypothetical protein
MAEPAKRALAQAAEFGDLRQQQQIALVALLGLAVSHVPSKLSQY